MATMLDNLRATSRRLLAALPDWHMLLVAGLMLLLLIGAGQLPLHYQFQVGIDEGIETDRPFMRDFRDPELITWDDSWRWSLPQAAIAIPGLGRRDVLLSFNIVSHRANWQPDAPPTTLYLGIGDRAPLALVLPNHATSHHLYIPAAAMPDGRLHLRLETEAWRNPADVRGELGVAIGRMLTITSVPGGGFVAPDVSMLLAWPLGMALFWLSLRGIGFERRQALGLALLPILAVGLIAVYQAPRLVIGNAWIVQAGLLALATAGIASALLPPFLRRFRALPDAGMLRWLVLLMVISFVIKYSGQLYPVSMPGDLQLHVNRFLRTVFGDVYIPAQHRGLPFPFPNGWYMLIAPFTLTGLSIYFLYEFTAGIFETLTVPLFYLMATRLTNNPRMGFLAALLYVLIAVGLMNTWWSFQTQVATQWFSTLLLTLLIVNWPDYDDWLVWGWITIGFILVFLGHIGSFLNTALVGLFIVPWLWFRARDDAERRGAVKLLWAGLASAGFVFFFYYSAFWDMITEQLGGLAAGGMLGVTGRNPLDRGVYLAALWHDGLITHYGFFPVLLALLSTLIVSLNGRLRHSLVPPMIWLTFAVALFQGVLPLFTLSSITTRWLTFAGWAIIIGSVPALLMFRQRGRAARLVSIAMLSYVAWISLVIWLNAMTLNQPPVEPF
jgi:hypothetical protein